MSGIMHSRRFLPLFLTQFLGAFNDNLLKNALVILATFSIAENNEAASQLTALAGGIFILPFFLFSATAGQVADKYDRAKIARIIKSIEIIIMVFAAAGFLYSNIYLLFVALFAMGTHSTFFGPVKFAILPQHLHEDELIAGNAYVEAGTFLAILLGTILGGILITLPEGRWMVSGALMAIAVAGYCCSKFIPAAETARDLVIGHNLFNETWRILRFAYQDKKVFLCLFGISWFWLVGATLLQEFAPYVQGVLHGEARLVTLFLTAFSFGIGCGSLICNILLKGEIKSTYVPYGAIGISLFTLDFFLASKGYIPHEAATVMEFIKETRNIRLLADLFLISASGGIFIVPLYAIMQHASQTGYRARIIAANNIMNALFMVFSALATIGMLKAGLTIPKIFLSIAVANSLVAVYMWKKLRSYREII